jgi:hypothetical protein
MNDESKDDCCKVCRVSHRYDFSDINQRLLRHWRGDATKRKGYRKLADWFNRLTLQRAMDRAGLPTVGGEVETKYQRLTGGDETTRSEVRALLENSGVDIERVEKHFVSYGVIRTHIKDCLGADREVATSDWESEAIEMARNIGKQKVQEAVNSLQNKDNLTMGTDITVDAEFYIQCNECETRVQLSHALRHGEVCQCETHAQGVVTND